MPNPMRGLLLAITLAALAACAGNTRPINPPNASIQQLDVLPDGRWKLQVRLENFSDQTVHYASLQAQLRVAGEAVGTLDLNPELDIPGQNADVVETTLSANPGAREAFTSAAGKPGGAPYELKGTILIPAAGKSFHFEHKSRLSPIPGVAGSYR